MSNVFKVIKILLFGSAILLGTMLIFFGYTDIPIEDLTINKTDNIIDTKSDDEPQLDIK